MKPKIYSPKDKKFEELVVIVPFFGAERLQLKRHIEMVNEFGFEAILVDLRKAEFSKKFHFFSSKGVFGMREVWTEQIESALNWFSQKKIVYAFSNPSACAIQAIARRKGVGISALICDSGPTTKMFSSLYAYYEHNEPVSFQPIRMLVAEFAARMWTISGENDLSDSMTDLPEGFPILSIRGWKDLLIPPQDIDKHFEKHKNIDWRKLSLPDAGHLNGLRDFPSEYIEPVRKFMLEFASPFQCDQKTI